MHAKDADLFLTSTSDTEAGTQYAGYTRTFGKGRFCCLTPGHTLKVFHNPEYRKILKNALDWCAGKI